MSEAEENLELVRRIVDVFNREDIEMMLAFTHPDFQLEVPPGLSAEPDTYSGQEGMRRYWESFQEAMDEIRMHVERLEDAGEAVVVAMDVSAKGRSTGIVVEQRLVGVWTVRDGKVMGIRVFPSLAEARDATGLAE